jgi:hypothetical protein
LKCWARGAALFLSVAAIQGSAQSALEVHNGAQETQARGFWTDPSTGLMWAAKDNDKDVTWNKAIEVLPRAAVGWLLRLEAGKYG